MFIKLRFLLLLSGLLLIRQVSLAQTQDSITINLKAMPGLQFDVVRFTVKPGAKVRINLTNADDMSHNLLITKPGARLDVVNAALQLEERGPAMNYIPKTSKLLWSIPVLSPNETKSVTFIAPKETGAYPYVCTYPGHGFVMYGAMYVTADGKMPPLKTDANIPPSRQQDVVAETKKNDAHAGHQMETAKPTPPHPYELVAPYLYRIFMEDASPAAIAVNLPKDLSYCWDAGSCSLRYAWYGGFLDNTAIWKGHADNVAKIVGTVFFRDKAIHQIIIGKASDRQEVEYRGYRLVNRYPEFHYTVNGTDVYELIQQKADGNGLVRTFKIPNASKTVWFISDAEDSSAKFESTYGKWEDGKLKLSKQEAREFTVTMTNYSLVYNNKRKK